MRRVESELGRRTAPAGAGLALLLAAALLLASPGPAPAAADHNCRFWACTADGIPAGVVSDHLSALPSSIERLSQGNPNGWSVAYYAGAEPTIRRGMLPAYLDPEFDSAVTDAAGSFSWIAVSHIRACSSGLCDIPNPHPFARQKNGKHWLMGHNGTIDKEVLLGLIRPEYFDANPPQYGDNLGEWIDSDLYFIYMLQTIEDFGWDTRGGIAAAVGQLRDAIPGDEEELNFFLTDGSTIWAYREGNSLYYLHEPAGSSPRVMTLLRPGPDGSPRPAGRAGAGSDSASPCGDSPAGDAQPWPSGPRLLGVPFAAVASQFPSSSQGRWVGLRDGQLVTLSAARPPTIEDI
jgi:hypothetical protein